MVFDCAKEDRECERLPAVGIEPTRPDSRIKLMGPHQRHSLSLAALLAVAQRDQRGSVVYERSSFSSVDARVQATLVPLWASRDAAALAGLRGPLPVQPDPRGARDRELGRRLADLPRGHLHDPVRRLLQKVRRRRRPLLVGLRPELAGLHVRMQEVAPSERGLGVVLGLVVGVGRAGPASYDADREQHADGLGDAAVAQGPAGDVAVPVSGEHQHHGLQQEVRGRRHHLRVRLRQGWAGLHVPMRRRDGAPGSARVAAGGGGALAAASALSLYEPLLIQPDSIR